MRVYMERVLTAVTLNLITEYQYLHNDAYYHSYDIHSLASLRGSNRHSPVPTCMHVRLQIVLAEVSSEKLSEY